MAYKFLKYRWQKISLTVLLIFSGLILLLAVFINSYWSPILEGKIKDIITKSSDSLYTVNFSSAELHILHGSIVLYNISLTPDTAVYNRKKKKHLAPNNLFELQVRKLTLEHVHPFRLYFYHKLDIGNIIVYSPRLNVSYQLNHTRDTVVKDNRTLWQKVSKSLHSIHVGNVIMGDVKFRYHDYSGHKLAISELREMNLSAHDLLIDSATQTDRSRLFYCRDVTAELNNYTAKTANGLYTYHINSLKLSTAKSQLNILGLAIKPAGTETFFTKSHKDRFSLRLDSAQLNHFDFLTYHKYRILTASSLVLSEGSFDVFTNPNKLPTKADKIKSFPNVALDNISADIKIDTVLFNQVNIVYSEYNKKSKKAGSLSFNHTSGRVLNITTNKAALKKNFISTVKLRTYFMNRGKLDLNFNFNLIDQNNSFDFKGDMGPMDLRVLNPATMPLAMVKINTGTLQEFSFNVNANRRQAKGKVTFLYNDAKVSLLKADTAMNKLKKKTIASLYANIFILKHNNPDNPGGQPRIAYVTYTRKPETPFFKTVWQTLLTGIKPSVGLDKKTEQATAEMMDKQAAKKQDRKTKKDQRKKRRAERKR
ncbi:MAG: hypothetical protein ACXVJD_04500 [Mucilaginibacter sp.]